MAGTGSTCADCGTTLAADGTCPSCEENGAPEAPAPKAAAPKPVPPQQKWMDQFKK